MIGNFPDICYLIKLLANKSDFHEHLRRNNSKFPLSDVFANGIALLAKREALAEYINSLQGHQTTKKSSYNTGGKDDNVTESDNDTVERQEKDLKNDNNIDNQLQ